MLEPYVPFLPNWHLEAMAEHLQAISRGDINRLLMNVPPGSLKSLMVSVFWQAWEWGPGRMPGNRFLTSSYSERWVKRDTRKTRDLILSEWFQRRWPTPLARSGETSFANTVTGTREGTPFEGLTAGRGDRVGVDDPHSTEKAESDAERERATRIFREALPSRVNDPIRSAIVIIMQRLHQDDVSGVLLSGSYGYEHLMLPTEFEPERASYTVVRPPWLPTWAKPTPARYIGRLQRWIKEADGGLPPDLAGDGQVVAEWESQPVRQVYLQDRRTIAGELLHPARYPRAEVERDKKAMTAYAWAGQHQQRPSPRVGGMFAVEKIRLLPRQPLPNEISRSVRYWDKAGTEGGGAYTAGARVDKLKDGTFCISDMVRGQWSKGRREAMIRQTAGLDRASGRRYLMTYVEQEPGSSGLEAADDTIRNALAGFLAGKDKVSGSKEVRAEPFAVAVDGDLISMVVGPWNADLLDELRNWPNGTYKDQGDAIAGAYAKIVGGSTYTLENVG